MSDTIGHKAEGRWALPGHEFGWPVIAWVCTMSSGALALKRDTSSAGRSSRGSVRYATRSIGVCRRFTRKRGVEISERTVGHLLNRYDEVLAVSLTDSRRLREQQGHVILVVDGLQPLPNQFFGIQISWSSQHTTYKLTYLFYYLLSLRALRYIKYPRLRAKSEFTLCYQFGPPPYDLPHAHRLFANQTALAYCCKDSYVAQADTASLAMTTPSGLISQITHTMTMAFSAPACHIARQVPPDALPSPHHRWIVFVNQVAHLIGRNFLFIKNNLYFKLLKAKNCDHSALPTASLKCRPVV